MKTWLRDSPWILPLSAIIAAALTFASPGNFWTGWLAYFILFLPGLLLLVRAWHWTGAGRSLLWAMGLGLFLRLGAALVFPLLLPIAGYDTEQQNAGYVFTDSFRRDTQAWDLAQSEDSILEAFDQKHYTDQYGGLLALSALTYRALSPDTHRPLLICLLAALAATLGVPFFWKAVRLLVNEKTARLAVWIFALYPESILQGSAQMREPFLITFIALAFYGLLKWQASHNRRSWIWIGLSTVGMLLVSPGIALITLVILAGWVWLEREGTPISWPAIGIGLAVLILILVVVSSSWEGLRSIQGSGPLGIISGWFQRVAKWQRDITEGSSGIVQLLFANLPAWTHIPFLAIYGITQPVLPAVLVEPSLPIWRILGVARTLGWYGLLPLLMYAPFAASNKSGTDDKQFINFRRGRSRVWLVLTIWVWILVASVRAGGDQWDNPRYRVIFLAFQALAAAEAWLHWRKKYSPWMIRILAVEAVSVLVLGYWYVTRYLKIFIHLGVRATLVIAILLALSIFAGGWAWDRLHNRT